MPRGRPKLINAQKAKEIAELFFLAFTDEQVATMVGISAKTIQRARTGEFCPTIKIAELRREAAYRRKIWSAKGFWQGAAWFLERKYPTQFAKPEIQLSFQNNYTQNNLSISVTVSEKNEIEALAEPVRQSVKDMFASYKPALGNGNGAAK